MRSIYSEASSSGTTLQTQAALQKLKQRRIVLLMDDAAPTFRAALVSPAESCNSALVNELLAISGGVTFVALSPDRTRQFLLGPMSRPLTNPARNSLPGDVMKTLESVEAREGVSTGISTADRAHTISILGEEHPQPRKLVKPGHIFPVEAMAGGLLVKNAFPEGALDAVRLAGFREAALFIDALNRDGEFMSRIEATAVAERWDIPTITLADLTRFRLEQEPLIEQLTEDTIVTARAGEMRYFRFRSRLNDIEHMALVKGEIRSDQPVVTRVQAEFCVGDILGSQSARTREQIDLSLEAINKAGCGVFVYLRRPLSAQLQSAGALSEASSHQHGASFAQGSPQSTNAALSLPQRSAWMMREYGIGAQILRALGVQKVELLTGSQRKLVGLTSFGIEILSQRPIPGIGVS